MPDATGITIGAVQQPVTVTNGIRYKLVEATVTTDETVTVNGIGTPIAIAYVAKKSSGAVCTNTVATNIVTVTEGALADEPLVMLVFGTAP